MSHSTMGYREILRRQEDAPAPLEAGSEKERLAIERLKGLLGSIQQRQVEAREGWCACTIARRNAFPGF